MQLMKLKENDIDNKVNKLNILNQIDIFFVWSG